MASWFEKVQEFAGDVTTYVGITTNDFIDELQKKHSDKVDALLDKDADHEALFKEYLGEPEFRTSVVEAFQREPEEFGELVETLAEKDPEFKPLEQAVNNDFVMAVALANPQILQEMLVPENMADPRTALLKYAEDPAVLGTIVAAENQYPEAYGEFREGLNQQIQELKASSDPANVALANDLESGLTKFDGVGGMDTLEETLTVAQQQNIDVTQAGIQVVAGNKLEALVETAKTSPEQAGQGFVREVAGLVDSNPAVQANLDKLLADQELMSAIGSDIAKNGADLQVMVPQLVQDPSAAFETMMDKHPEMLQAAVPIVAAADPKAAGEMALKGIEENLRDTIKGLPEAERDAANAYVDDFVADMGQNDAFLNSLGNRLADVEQGGQMLENLGALDKVSGVAGFDGMKVVLNDMKQNPDAVMNIIASEQMMGLAMHRWSGKMFDAKIDNAFDNLEDALNNFANGEMGHMLRGMGIDISAITNQLGGFKDMLQQAAGPMLANLGANMSDYQVAGQVISGVRENLGHEGMEGLSMNSRGGNLFDQVRNGYDRLQLEASGAAYHREMGVMPADYKQRQIDFETQVAERAAEQDPSVQRIDSQTGRPAPTPVVNENGVQTYALGNAPVGTPLQVETVSNEPDPTVAL